jgi:hypothetical protein
LLAHEISARLRTLLMQFDEPLGAGLPVQTGLGDALLLLGRRLEVADVVVAVTQSAQIVGDALRHQRERLLFGCRLCRTTPYQVKARDAPGMDI